MLRIEPLMSVMPYNDRSNITITDFSHPEQFTNEGSTKGIEGGINTFGEKVSMPGNYGLFAASARDLSPGEGYWIKMEKKYSPWLDLSKNQGLGVWINGDGNGELLNLRIESPKHLSHGARGDHFIKIDFKGWKYFELVEIESSEFSNYIWPDSGFYVYDSFRHTVQFNNVDKLQLWYNNLPAGKEVNCVIGDVKALPLVAAKITNPSVTVNGEKLTFLTEMESGMYLEFYSLTDCKLYGPKGEFLEDVKVEGIIPSVKIGENLISFSCNGPNDVNPRTQVTLINEGDPLMKQVF